MAKQAMSQILPDVEQTLVGRVATLYDIDHAAADEALQAVKSPTAYLTMGAKRHGRGEGTLR